MDEARRGGRRRGPPPVYPCAGDDVRILPAWPHPWIRSLPARTTRPPRNLLECGTETRAESCRRIVTARHLLVASVPQARQKNPKRADLATACGDRETRVSVGCGCTARRRYTKFPRPLNRGIQPSFAGVIFSRRRAHDTSRHRDRRRVPEQPEDRRSSRAGYPGYFPTHHERP